jgi:4-amino-4-deoxy-L-arabinose transferase-like glycosyltransferase
MGKFENINGWIRGSLFDRLDMDWFWIILGTSLIVKGFFFYKLSPFPDRFYTPDSYQYKQLATNLINYKRFATFSYESKKLYPENFRTPAYPLFLAVILHFTPNGLPFEYLVALIQIILSSFTCGLVYVLSKRLFNKTAATIAGLLSLSDITSSAYANIMLSDTLFVFLFFVSVYLLVVGIIDQRESLLGGAGLFLGLASLCRPIVLYSVLLFILFFICFRKKISLYSALSFLLPFFLLIGCWKTRNYIQTGNSAFSTAIYGYIVDVASDLKAANENQPQEKIKADLRKHIIGSLKQEESASKSMDDVNSFKWEMESNDPRIFRLVLSSLLDHIVQLPEVILNTYSTSLVRFMLEPDYISYVWCFGSSPYIRFHWSWDNWGNIIRGRYGLSLVLFSQIVLLFVLWVGFIYGAIFSSCEKWWAVLLTMLVLYFALVTTLSHIEMRFRMPVIPLLAVGAGYGLSKLYALFRN